MSTGKRAFRKDTAGGTLNAILSEEPKPVAHVTRRIARGVDTILNRCLRKDPAQRYQKISEVQSSLKRLKADYYSKLLPGVHSSRLLGARHAPGIYRRTAGGGGRGWRDFLAQQAGVRAYHQPLADPDYD